jgi:hypothetical protein
MAQAMKEGGGDLDFSVISQRLGKASQAPVA